MSKKRPLANMLADVFFWGGKDRGVGGGTEGDMREGYAGGDVRGDVRGDKWECYSVLLVLRR